MLTGSGAALGERPREEGLDERWLPEFLVDLPERFVHVGLHFWIRSQALGLGLSAVEQVGDPEVSSRPAVAVAASEEAFGKVLDLRGTRGFGECGISRLCEADGEENGARGEQQKAGGDEAEGGPVASDKLSRRIQDECGVSVEFTAVQKGVEVTEQGVDRSIALLRLALKRFQAEHVEVGPLAAAQLEPAVWCACDACARPGGGPQDRLDAKRGLLTGNAAGQ